MERVTSRRPAILGVEVDPVELSEAVDRVVRAAEDFSPLGVSALAVHGLTLASQDAELRYRVNDLEMVVADGQPVRWALNLLYHCSLSDRVFGPSLMWEVCAAAANQQLPIFLYGSTSSTLDRLESRLRWALPGLRVAGRQPSRFRAATEEEAEADRQLIRSSGARIVFVGLGCPRQEIWAYENREALSMPILAVGAAFDYHAGNLRRAPGWMQGIGLEWLFRLWQEPQRLWQRYLVYNSLYVGRIMLQVLGLRHYRSAGTEPHKSMRPS